VRLALALLVALAGCDRSPADGEPGLGKYRIRTFPAGARVWVGGELVLESTPGTLILPAGEHDLRLQATGAEPRFERITVEAAKAGVLDIRIPEPPPARLSVLSDAVGAEVRVNGYKRGVTPLMGVVTRPGAFDVTVTAAGEARSVRGRLAIGEQKLLEVFFAPVTSRPEDGEPAPPPPPMSLPPPTGKLTLGLEPRGTAETLDGRALGASPIHDLELAEGEHEVVLRSLDGRYRKQVRLEVEPGRTAVYRFMFRPDDEVPGWQPPDAGPRGDGGARPLAPGDGGQGGGRP
jgi:hypothetical protein